LGAGRRGQGRDNLEEVYRRLDAEDDQLTGDLNEILATHPLLIHRIKELRKFAVQSHTGVCKRAWTADNRRRRKTGPDQAFGS